MKARAKGTANIIEVEFDRDALNACYPPYHDKENNMYYYEEQLEWVDNEVNANPDYWTRLEHQYAGMAMQGLLSNERCWEENADKIAEVAICYAKELVKGLMIERSN
jgi:hypothetical protein